jgi:hypothetical protein
LRERKCGFVSLDDLHALLLCSTLFVCLFLFLVVEDKGFGSDKELLEKVLDQTRSCWKRVWDQTSSCWRRIWGFGFRQAFGFEKRLVFEEKFGFLIGWNPEIWGECEVGVFVPNDISFFSSLKIWVIGSGFA